MNDAAAESDELNKIDDDDEKVFCFVLFLLTDL